jgi:hypothetical protein
VGKKHADQEIFIGPLPKGAGRQEVHVNPPGGRPSSPSSSTKASSSMPHYAPGTERLGVFGLLLALIVLAVCAFLVISACGMASALVTGSIW